MKTILLTLFNFILVNFALAGLPEKLKDESDLTLETRSGKISGSMVYPKSKRPIMVVLIIAGSGPTDRNGNNTMGLKTDTYKMIAEELRKSNIASVRFDKRLIGKSADTSKKEIDFRFDDLVNDAVDWINLLKNDKRFSKVIVAGHSEGSLVGMIAAAKTNADGYISIAGCGTSADKILKEQLAAQSKFFAEASFPIIDSLAAGKTVDNINPLLMQLFRPSVQPYIISWFKYDPAIEIAKLKIPVLILQGTTDIQVKTKDAELLSKAKPDAKLVVIKNMNHVLKDCVADMAANVATYSDRTLPLKPEFVAAMKDFLKEIK